MSSCLSDYPCKLINLYIYLSNITISLVTLCQSNCPSVSRPSLLAFICLSVSLSGNLSVFMTIQLFFYYLSVCPSFWNACLSYPFQKRSVWHEHLQKFLKIVFKVYWQLLNNLTISENEIYSNCLPFKSIWGREEVLKVVYTS